MLEITNNKMTSHARHRSSEIRFKRLGPHFMSALQVWLLLLLFVFQNELRMTVSAQPGYLDFDNLPDTNFSCVGKVIGGYYADLETSCQMFHVCTIGQQEEAMDIKFLCLNGTVFDQETRVCERVDEVDCSKSERFYNLNLELYGNTAPPFIEPEQAPKPIEPEEDNAEDDEEQYEEDEVDYSEPSTTTVRPQTTTTITTTQPTTQPTTTTHYTSTQFTTTHYRTTSHYKDETSTKLAEESDDYTLSDNKDSNHDKVEHKFPSGQNYETVTDRNNENVSPTFSTSVKLNPSYGPPAHDTRPEMSPQYQIHKIISPQEFIYQHTPQSSQGNKNEAISFQQQTFSNNGQNTHITVTSHNVDHKSQNDNKGNANTLAEKIYITSSSPRTDHRYSEVEQIDKYEIYESSKNIPLINLNRPPTVSPSLSPPKQQIELFQFSLKNPSRIPQGFKLNPTTQNPHSQLLSPNPKNILQNLDHFGTSRPIQNYQPSERHEILFENRFQLPTEIPLAHDYNHYHYERKRSHDAQQPQVQSNEQVVPRSVPKTTTEENQWVPYRNHPKSPPRVIVTASASVSDSNGKKLNYTVGNVVHAVKPIVPVNYDNFREEDVIVDPFFLDVPKLIKKRSERHALGNKRIKRNTIINISPHLNSSQNIWENVTQRIENPPNIVETTMKVEEVNKTNSTTVANAKLTSFPVDTTKWSPPDYVDDNYEPNVYKEPQSNYTQISEIQKDASNSSDATTSTTPSGGTKSPGGSKDLEKIKQDYLKEYLKKITEFHKIVKENSEKYLQLNIEFEKSRQPNKVALVTSKPLYEMNKSSHLEKPLVINNPAKLADTLNRMSISKLTTFKPALLTTIRPGIKYTLVTVTTSLNLDSSETKTVFTCSGKDYHRFYPDPTNCRNFHLCTPGYNKYQVLDMVFECDSNLLFNYETLECSNDKPNNCYTN